MISSRKPLPRHLLDLPVPQVDVESAAGRIHEQDDLLTDQLLFARVGLQIDGDAPMRIDLAGKSLPVYARQPTVRIDLLGERWQWWQDRMRDTRGVIAAGAPPL